MENGIEVDLEKRENRYNKGLEKEKSDILMIDHNAPVDVLKVWLFDLPVLAYDSNIQSFGSHENLKALEKQVQDIKSRVSSIVCSEIGEDKKLKYTNASARESELNTRLFVDEVYQKKVEQIRVFSLERDSKKSSAEYYGRMFTVVKLLVLDKLERERLNIGKELMLKKAEFLEGSK